MTAQPPPGEADTVAVGERAELLATKLTVPSVRPDLLPRTDLVRRLDEGSGRSLVLVCAPAGFGKTTMLAEWASGTSRPVAWVSLDRDDNDPTRFWRYLVAALGRVCAGVAERVLPLLAAPTVLSGEGVATAVINELEAASDDVVLVLDDYHVIDSPPIHDGLAFLLGHLPPRLHVVISGRADPPLPVARLRANGQLAEFRAGDLRFTAEESAAFLAKVWGLELSAQAVAALESRTEGWAAGLQLAALSLRGRPDPEAFLDAFTGSHRYVLDYLSQEVLERQPDEVRRFLLETSILERLSGPLCDAVTGGTDGHGMLERLERANLFLVPLDEQRRWYRYHHLFADLLRARLTQTRSHQVSELHRRAAAWLEQHGLIGDAIRHTTAAGDTDWAMRLVEGHLDETLRRGEQATLLRWLSVLPEDTVRSSPAVCLAKAMTEHQLDHLESAERFVDHAEHAFQHQGRQPRKLEVPTHGGMVADVSAAIALLRAELAADRADAEGVAGFARSALDRMAEQERGPRLYARSLVVGADWMRGRVAEAEPAFAELLQEAKAVPEPYPLLSSRYMLGLVQQARGKLDAALHTYREGLRLASEDDRFSPYHAGEAHIGIAQVLYQRNELDEAFRHATDGVELSRQVIELTELDVALVTLAWIRQAMGEPDAALDAMNEACRTYSRPDVVSLGYPAQSERARLWLAQGRVEEAARWTHEHRLTEHDEVSYLREGDHLVLARVLLARSQQRQALRLLERLDALANAQDRTGSLIQIRALRSLALQAGGDHQDALTLLAQTLTMAAPEGYIRVFVDEGAAMAALLRSLLAACRRDRAPAGFAATEHLSWILRALGPATHEAGPALPAVTGLVETLTDRELEVLRLLATGRRNRDIAKQLVVTVETVKKHVSHILTKMEASSRTEAVAQARRLGLID